MEKQEFDKAILKNIFDHAIELGIAKHDVDCDNIFSILQIEDKERFHSRFLCYLIKTHYNSFKEYFEGQKDIVFPDGKLKSDNCCCEYHCGKMKGCKLNIDGFIDIYLPLEQQKAIAVEVKWYAEDQPKQLLRYKNCLKENYGVTAVLLYLSLGKTPSDGSVGCEDCTFKTTCENKHEKLKAGKDYYYLSFNDISEWIKSTILKDKIKDLSDFEILIKQYADVLENEINANKVTEMIENEIKNQMARNKQKTADIYDALGNIESGIDELRKKIYDSFLKAIRERAKTLKGYEFIDKGEDFKQISDADEYVKFACIDKNGAGFTISWQTNLYSFKILNKKITDTEQWAYITKKWFDGELHDFGKNKTYKTNVIGKKAKELFDWYFLSDEEKNKKIDNILETAKRFCSKNS